MSLKVDIEEAPFVLNVADKLDQSILDEVGNTLQEYIKLDEDSRATWLENNEEWMKLASQVREHKNFPWEGASNVKYPLLTLAAVQFHSRALPALIDSSKPVKAKIVGFDLTGEKMKRARRVSTYLSYQVLEEMNEWLDDFDRLLFVLSIVGVCYKKAYYSVAEQKVRSTLVLPQDLIVNYHARDLSRARLTHKVLMDRNELIELQNEGIFRDVDLTAIYKDVYGSRDEILSLTHSAPMEDEPYELWESHCWYDLDGDGYKEPYIITLHADSGTVLRIVPRWKLDGIKRDDKEKVIKIIPEEYFIPYRFLPDPNSSVYGLGFGSLLGPNNESVNTIINQLIDAGTLSNLQSGFLARGVKIRGGSIRFKPGEWKIVNTTGDDLRKGVFPMPVQQPSATLFQLLGLLIQSSERVASVTDAMVGENPGQNQAATTTMAVLEQGQKVFTGINKRIHRALGKEYKRLYEIFSVYLDEDHYKKILDEKQDQPQVPEAAMQAQPQNQGGAERQMDPEMAQQMQMQQQAQMQMQASQQQAEIMFAGIQDFALDGMDIVPASDPNMSSESQKAMKAQSLLEKAMSGLPINIGEVTRQVLESEGHENIERLMQVPPAQPDPKMELEKAKLQQQQQISMAELQLRKMEVENEAIKDKTTGMLNMAKVEGLKVDSNLKPIKMQTENVLEQEKLSQNMNKLKSDRMKALAAMIKSKEAPQNKTSE